LSKVFIGLRSSALLVLAGIIPLILFALVATLGSLHQQEEATKVSALEAAKRISAIVDTELKHQLTLVQALAALPELDDPAILSRFEEVARRWQVLEPLWLSVILASPDGTVLIDTQLGRSSIVELESFRKAVDDKTPVIGKVARGITRTAFAVRAPAIRAGKVRYVVSVVLKVDQLRALLVQSGLSPSWVGAIVDADGIIAARTQGEDEFLGRRASERALEARIFTDSGTYEGAMLDGTLTISAFARSPDTGFSVHIGIPKEIIFAPVTRSLIIAALEGAATIALTGTFLFLAWREFKAQRIALARVEQRRKLEAVGLLTSGVAHDLNNLLHIMTSSLSLIERRWKGVRDEPSFRSLGKAVTRAISLSNGLLSYSHPENAEQPENIDNCLTALYPLIKSTVGSGIVVTLEPHKDLPLVCIDRVQFDLAMLNLTANARDAMNGVGKLLISSHLKKTAGEERQVCITVEDDGPGISKQAKKRAFEPLFTTKGPSKGSGLGLSQVKDFVDRSRGSVSISNKSVRGAIVSINLPALAVTPRRADFIEGSTGPILIVDDEPDVREIAVEIIRELGFETIEASSAVEALNVLQRTTVIGSFRTS